MDGNEIDRDEIAVAVQARIALPIQWREGPPDVKIQDLKEAHYGEACRLIKHHYFREEPMCKASSFWQDSESVECYLNLINVWIRDTTSIVALSVRTGRVVGVAVTRIDSAPEKTDTYNRVQRFDGEALLMIKRLKSTLIKQARIYTRLGIDVNLRIYVMCVHPSHRCKGVETGLLRACAEVAKSLKMPAVVGIFSSAESQATASNLGYQTFAEIRYSRWIVDDEVVFDDPGIGNYSAAFMGVSTSIGKVEAKKRDDAKESSTEKSSANLTR